jgi:hypothetical protein
LDLWLAENNQEKSEAEQSDKEKELSVLKIEIDGSELEICKVQKVARMRAKLVKEMLGIVGEAMQKKQKDLVKLLGITLEHK